jgi:DNA-binding beta-propeller fold protein YncE
MSFAPNGRSAYTANELNSTVTAFGYDKATGRLSEIQTLPSITGYDDANGINYPSELEVDSRGKFLYLANRNGDNIAVFIIGTDGKLAPSSQTAVGGKYPRHFALDPSGNYLLVENQNSDNIVEFRVERTTGALTPTGVDLKISIPMCVVFAPAKEVAWSGPPACHARSHAAYRHEWRHGRPEVRSTAAVLIRPAADARTPAARGRWFVQWAARRNISVCGRPGDGGGDSGS